MVFYPAFKIVILYGMTVALWALSTLAHPLDLAGDVVPSMQTTSDVGGSIDQRHPWQPLLEGQTEAVIRQYQNGETAPRGLLNPAEFEEQMLVAWEDGGEQNGQQAPKIPEPYSFLAGGLFLIFALMGRRQRPIAC